MKIILVPVQVESKVTQRIKENLIQKGHSVAVLNLEENMSHSDLNQDEIIIFINEPLLYLEHKVRNMMAWANKKGANFLFFNSSSKEQLLPNLDGDISNLAKFI